MKVVSGRHRSPQRKTNPSDSDEGSAGLEQHEKADGDPSYKGDEAAAEEDHNQNPNGDHVSEKGSSVNQGFVPDIQQSNSETVGNEVIRMESGVMAYMGIVGQVSNLKGCADSDKLKIDEIIDSGVDGLSSRPKSKWTRLVRMEVGPVASEGNNYKEKLGKRKTMHCTEEDKHDIWDVPSLKQQKVDGKQTLSSEKSARVETHPCREQ